MSKIVTSFDALKAANAFSSTEETRYYLNGVFVDGETFVATDGHRLAIIKPEVFKSDAPFTPLIIPRQTVSYLEAIEKAYTVSGLEGSFRCGSTPKPT